MKEKKNKEDDANFAVISSVVFLEYYNRTIPTAFPPATVESLAEFRAAYPALFGSENEADDWGIDKHRKKFMDWHRSHQDFLDATEGRV